MPRKIDIKPELIKTKSSPRAAIKQYGSTTPKLFLKKEALLAYERVVNEDVITSASVDIFIQAILSSVGEVIHEDPEIAEFCNYVLKRYEDVNSTSWLSLLAPPIRTMLWAGASVSEEIFTLDKQKRMVLDDLVTYHPATILIYADKNGRLTEGKESYFSPLLKSGIYQSVSNSKNDYAYRPSSTVYNYQQVLLPRKKVIYLSQKSEFGDFYGKSSIAPIYRWVLLKEAFIDMMATALDKYGNPIFYISMPDINTGQTVESDDPDGYPRAVTTFETLRNQLANLGSQGNGLLLPFTSKDNKPEVGQIVAAPNIGNVFKDAIRFCDEQIAINLGVPFFLISGELHGREKQETEHRMSIFYHRVETHRQKILSSICSQLFQKLIEYNFDGRPGANIPPSFSKVYGNRAEDRVATMQVVQGLAKSGVLNPQHQVDFSLMREMLDLPSRQLAKEDKDFFDLIYRKANAANNGRPRGVSKPQTEARPRTKAKPTGKVTAKSTPAA